MMDVKFNSDTVNAYHFRYKREYRVVAVLWTLLSIIWCILNLVVFVQPQWIGDTYESPGYGHLGLFRYCYPDSARQGYTCYGDFTDFDTILSDSFRACTFFVGISALLMLVVIAALLLFFCFKRTTVFLLSGILQLISAILMLLACIIYPSGWSNSEVTTICGTESGEYKLGLCSIRWAYMLAILGFFDAAVLAVLAFCLASKQACIELYSSAGSVHKSELNHYQDSASKPSIPIHPQLVASLSEPGNDHYSELSHSRRAQAKGFQL